MQKPRGGGGGGKEGEGREEARCRRIEEGIGGVKVGGGCMKGEERGRGRGGEEGREGEDKGGLGRGEGGRGGGERGEGGEGGEGGAKVGAKEVAKVGDRRRSREVS